MTTAAAPPFETGGDGRHAEVAIVGAGIAGLTAALLLRESGRSVVVIDKGRIGCGESSATTAHITAAVDARFHAIRRSLGPDAARIVAAAGLAAIDTIESIAQKYAIDCHFHRLPGFLYTENRSRVSDLKNEAVSAREAGLRAEWTTDVPLPFPTRGAVRFDDQAQFHPRQYLLGIARQLQGSILENTTVLHIEEGSPCVVETNVGRITADQVLVATNAPINDLMLHTRIAAYRSYAIAMHWEDAHPDALFWDTATPYHYTRWQETDSGTFLIVGGADHKVGQDGDTAAAFDTLQQFAFERFGTRAIRYRWSGQIIEPADGLPYIGRVASRILVATGFSGQGMTLGTAAAILVRDLVEGQASEWMQLFDPGRVPSRNSIGDLIAENLDYPKHLLLDRVASRDVETKNTFDVKSGEGKIVTTGGHKVALARDEEGSLHALLPVCTHMGCDVAWNGAEKSWDCPCHGSRYAIDGSVLNGPATAGLERIEIDDDESRL